MYNVKSNGGNRDLSKLINSKIGLHPMKFMIFIKRYLRITSFLRKNVIHYREEPI